MPLLDGAYIGARRATTQNYLRSGFVCLQCRRQTSFTARRQDSPITLPLPTRRHASSLDSRVTAWARKKIWGKNPPGPADPYAKVASPEDMRQLEAEKEQNGQEDNNPVFEEENFREEYEAEFGEQERVEEYVPAETWHGLRSFKPRQWDAMQEYRGSVYIRILHA